MITKPFTRTIALLGLASLSIALTACSASSQGLSSRSFDNFPASKSGTSGTSKSQPEPATLPTLNLDLSVEAAYAAIPHKRTAMDFAASSMPDQDKQYLESAFHVVDQAIRLRVTAYQKFARGEVDASLIADMERLIDYLQNTEAPSNLSNYRRQLLQAMSDQKAFFEEWKAEGQGFRYGQSVAGHPKVQSASTALRSAYGILMQKYPGETDHNKEAFFDYHCALDFI